MPDFTFERHAGGLVAGIDEAGRGPLAGPVVAAAVVLDDTRLPSGVLDAIDDSKRLSAGRRRDLAAAIGGHAAVGVGQASVDEIDRLNVLQATMLAMARAVAALGRVPDRALVDGNRLPDLPCPAEALIGGDRRSLSIAAASIVAKVTRDGIMAKLDRIHPAFGWIRNAGYGTAEHLAALNRHGPTAHHRVSFAPVARVAARDARRRPADA